MSQPDIRNARFNGSLYFLPSWFHVDEDDCVPSCISQLEALMENRVRVGRGTDCGIAITGEPYIEFAAGISDGWMADEKLIFWMWLAFIDYRNSVIGNPVLYWRVKPELVTFDANENFDTANTAPREPRMVRRIYMRYLVSALPAQEKYFEPA